MSALLPTEATLPVCVAGCGRCCDDLCMQQQLQLLTLFCQRLVHAAITEGIKFTSFCHCSWSKFLCVRDGCWEFKVVCVLIRLSQPTQGIKVRDNKAVQCPQGRGGRQL